MSTKHFRPKLERLECRVVLSAAPTSATSRYEALVASLDVLRAKIRPTQVISIQSFAISTNAGSIRRYLAPTKVIESTIKSGPAQPARDPNNSPSASKDRENPGTATVLPRVSRVTIVGVIDPKETNDDFLFPVDPLSTGVSIALSYQTASNPAETRALVLSTEVPSYANAPVAPSSSLTPLGIPTGYIGISIARGGDGWRLPGPVEPSTYAQNAVTPTNEPETARATASDSVGTSTELSGGQSTEGPLDSDAAVDAAPTYEAIYYTLVIEQASALTSPDLALPSASVPATIRDGQFERSMSGRVGWSGTVGTGAASFGLIVSRTAEFDVLVVSVGAGDGVSGALPLRASGPLAGAMSEEPVSRTVDLRDALALELAWYLLDDGILSQDADDPSAGAPIALSLSPLANGQVTATRVKSAKITLRVADWPPASSEFVGVEDTGRHSQLLDHCGTDASGSAMVSTPDCPDAVEQLATESAEKQETDTQRTQFVRAVVTMGWALAFTFLLPDLSAFFVSRTDKSRSKRSKLFLRSGRRRQAKPEN